MELTRQPAAKTLIPAIAITDSELLMRFARHNDQAAFTTLVEKHGRLVWAVCWQVLREHHEIEDAFQSTFFILAKRARSIRSSDTLCGWLYRVAYRTALRARMASKPKPLSELVAEELSTIDDKFQAIEQHEQRAVLMEELHTLPEQYQQPLILCYLEGKSRRVIADELGCSLETIKGRLARGRQVLRHRLIRRGFSLSVAMGTMSLPLKTATAAVTPQLIGLTATGAAGWAAGATAAAKISTTVSSQVIQLAHQGTVAMTIASFTKPVVLSFALLGAVSASLAIDTAGDGGKGPSTARAIDLTAANTVQITANVTGEDEAAVEVTVGEEVAEEIKEPNKKVAGRKVQGKITAHELTIGQKKDEKGVLVLERRVAPPRTAQPVQVRVPQPPVPLNTYSAPAVPQNMYPAQPPTPVYYPQPYPVVQPLDIQVGGLNVEANLKLRTHEARVAELQLESKVLEIESFDAKDEEREALLKESRKKLLMAEAEELRMQVERQKEEIKQLEKAMKEQAEGIEKQAAQHAEQAKTIAKQAAKHAKNEAITFAAVAAKEAQAAATSELAAAWGQSGSTSPDTIQPGDQIAIEAIGVLPDKPIEGTYSIEPSGTVPLGAAYGRVKIAGMTVIDAEQAILKELKKTVEDPKVQVTLQGRMLWSDFPVPTSNRSIPHPLYSAPLLNEAHEVDEK
jgi:RNA polymerase sigma factor (sigma-70 family)